MLFNSNDLKKNICNVECGDNVSISDFVNLYGCEIGDNTKVGPFVEIQRGVKIGSNCKIQSHSFICEGVEIGNGVFVGHNVTFINDKHPKAVDDEGNMITSEWTMVNTKVEDEVSIGSGAIIMGGYC